jgi:hypothetical protein
MDEKLNFEQIFIDEKLNFDGMKFIHVIMVFRKDTLG